MLISSNLIYNFFHQIRNPEQTSESYHATQILENPVNGIQAAIAFFHDCIILFYKNVYEIGLFERKPFRNRMEMFIVPFPYILQ